MFTKKLFTEVQRVCFRHRKSKESLIGRYLYMSCKTLQCFPKAIKTSENTQSVI